MSITVEREGQLIIYTFQHSTDAAIEDWFAHASAAMEQPFSILMDVSSPNVSFTRHARQKSLELFQRHRQQPGRMAFLFSSRIAPHFARIFFAALGSFAFEVQFFSDRQAALTWLKKI